MANTNCSNFDAAVPGTGPMRSIVPTQSVEFEKYNKTYNYSLKSKSDLNLNPQPEGNVYGAYPKAEQNREGIYAIDTDRGELSPTMYVQTNTNGQKTFQNRIQDTIRPTMKETTLYSYDGFVAPVTSKEAVYSQFIPQYANIGGQQVRIGGSSNFGLKTATEYSYFSGAAPTGINGQAIQNPDARLGKNTQPIPDNNVDGAGTSKGFIPDGSKFQQYRPLPKPTSNALRFTYNLETNGGSVADYSPLLGKEAKGIENRYTSSYQIAPLMNNPLSVIWNPDGKGTIPEFFMDPQPLDYSYNTFQNLPQDTFNYDSGYNTVWQPDKSKTSSNAYVLDLETGIHNPRLEWIQGANTLPGVTYSPDDTFQKVPTQGYGGATDVYQQYMVNQLFKSVDNTYTTLGDPSAGFIGKSIA
jgi:hypothetical protein